MTIEQIFEYPHTSLRRPAVPSSWTPAPAIRPRPSFSQTMVLHLSLFSAKRPIVAALPVEIWTPTGTFFVPVCRQLFGRRCW